MGEIVSIVSPLHIIYIYIYIYICIYKCAGVCWNSNINALDFIWAPSPQQAHRHFV